MSVRVPAGCVTCLVLISIPRCLLRNSNAGLLVHMCPAIATPPPPRPLVRDCCSVFLSWRESLRVRSTLEEAMLALRVNPGVTHHTYTEAPAPAPAPGTTTLAPRTGRRSSVGPGARQAGAAPRRRSSVDASARLAGVKSSGCVWLSLLLLSGYVL